MRLYSDDKKEITEEEAQRILGLTGTIESSRYPGREGKYRYDIIKGIYIFMCDDDISTIRTMSAVKLLKLKNRG